MTNCSMFYFINCIDFFHRYMLIMNVLPAICFKHVGTGDVCWQIVEYGVIQKYDTFFLFQTLIFSLFCIFTNNKFAGVSFLFQFLYLLQPTAFTYQRDFSVFVMNLKLNSRTQNQQKTASSSSCRDLLFHLLMALNYRGG